MKRFFFKEFSVSPSFKSSLFLGLFLSHFSTENSLIVPQFNLHIYYPENSVSVMTSLSTETLL